MFDTHKTNEVTIASVDVSVDGNRNALKSYEYDYECAGSVVNKVKESSSLSADGFPASISGVLAMVFVDIATDQINMHVESVADKGEGVTPEIRIRKSIEAHPLNIEITILPLQNVFSTAELDEACGIALQYTLLMSRNMRLANDELIVGFWSKSN